MSSPATRRLMWWTYQTSSSRTGQCLSKTAGYLTSAVTGAGSRAAEGLITTECHFLLLHPSAYTPSKEQLDLFPSFYNSSTLLLISIQAFVSTLLQLLYSHRSSGYVTRIYHRHCTRLIQRSSLTHSQRGEALNQTEYKAAATAPPSAMQNQAPWASDLL